MTTDLYTLDDLSERLGGVPLSTLKHRIAQLGIPAAARGSRNKLLFDERAATLLEASDQLLRQGNGLTTTRRLLGLDLKAEPLERPTVETGESAPTSPEPEIEVTLTTSAPEGESASLQRLSHALEQTIAQLEQKDRQIAQLHEDIKRALEAAATFQQKTFYLQGELQRLRGELKEAHRASHGMTIRFPRWRPRPPQT